MSIPPLRTTFASLFGLALLGAWTLTPPRQDGAAIGHEAVAGTVHMLTGRGGNLGVSVGPDGTVLVDDKFLDLAPAIGEALDELDGSGNGAPRFVLNTHHHGDHTGANPAFGRVATIVAHDNVRARLAAGDTPMDAAGLPVVTFAQGVVLHLNGETIRLVHYPAAHTDGDSVVHFEGSDVAHLGDLFFNGLFPYIDRDSGGSAVGMERAIAATLEDIGPDTKIIPGHGPLASRADLVAYHEMLASTIALVREALEAGDDVDAMVSNGLLADYESWSWGFIDTRSYLTVLAGELGGG